MKYMYYPILMFLIGCFGGIGKSDILYEENPKTIKTQAGDSITSVHRKVCLDKNIDGMKYQKCLSIVLNHNNQHSFIGLGIIIIPLPIPLYIRPKDTVFSMYYTDSRSYGQWQYDGGNNVIGVLIVGNKTYETKIDITNKKTNPVLKFPVKWTSFKEATLIIKNLYIDNVLMEDQIINLKVKSQFDYDASMYGV